MVSEEQYKQYQDDNDDDTEQHGHCHHGSVIVSTATRYNTYNTAKLMTTRFHPFTKLPTCHKLISKNFKDFSYTFQRLLPVFVRKRKKGKEEYLYSTFLHQGTHKALRHGSHSFNCKQHHACLSFVSVHQMAPPQQLRQQTSNCSLLLIYRPQKDERLSWPSWLTSYVGHLRRF